MSHKWWGHLSQQTGFYEYGLSPFQLRAFAGFFNPGAYLLFTRTARQVAFIAPPLVAFYSLAKWADGKFEFYHRKEYLFSEQAILDGNAH